jgi:hypothetical protein
MMNDHHILVAIGARPPSGPAYRLGGLVIPVVSPEPCYRLVQIGRGQPITCGCSRCAVHK